MKGIKIKKRLKLLLIILLIILNSFIALAEKVSSSKLMQKLLKLKKLKNVRKKNKTVSHKRHKLNSTNAVFRKKNKSAYSKSVKMINPLTKQIEKSPEENNFFKFMLGFGVGFGLKVDASEELKKCFFANKKKNSKIIKNFILNETEKNNNANILEKDKENQKESAQTFTKTAMEFFTKFKDCNAFKETFLTFVKNKIINLGIKGIAYIVAGPLGLILKGTYDIYKIITEISNFYNLKKQTPLDYYNLGSAVGKIIYYTQNILLKKKKF